MPVICLAVSQVNFDEFTTAFNLAYSDYQMPIAMTAPGLRALMERDDLNPDASVAAVDQGTIVGTGLLGIRDSIGWIGGMGVIPKRRRQGIGRQMMHYLLDRARDHRLARVDLEVIETNTGAYNLYRQFGFKEYRNLLVLERDPAPVPDPPTLYVIEKRPPAELIPYYAAFHNSPNCWQRALPSLKALTPHLQGWAALEEKRIVGYGLGWASDYDVRLIDFAAAPDSDQTAVGQVLLAYLHRQNPGAYGSSYNVAEDDPVLPAYEALGYVSVLRQIEMRLEQ